MSYELPSCPAFLEDEERMGTASRAPWMLPEPKKMFLDLELVTELVHSKKFLYLLTILYVRDYFKKGLEKNKKTNKTKQNSPPLNRFNSFMICLFSR